MLCIAASGYLAAVDAAGVNGVVSGIPEIVGQIGGGTNTVEIDNSGGVVIGVGPRIVRLVPATEPSEALQSVSPVLPGIVRDLEVSRGYAFAVVGEGGLCVLDLRTTEREIAVVATLWLPGVAQSIAIDNEMAYIAGGESGLVAIDIGFVESPMVIDVLSEWGRAHVQRVAASNGVIAVTTGGGEGNEYRQVNKLHIVKEAPNGELSLEATPLIAGFDDQLLGPIALEEDYLLLGAGADLIIFDLADYSKPTIAYRNTVAHNVHISDIAIGDGDLILRLLSCNGGCSGSARYSYEELPSITPHRGVLYDTIRDVVSGGGRIRSAGIAEHLGRAVDVLADGRVVEIDFSSSGSDVVTAIGRVDPALYRVAMHDEFLLAVGPGSVHSYAPLPSTMRSISTITTTHALDKMLARASEAFALRGLDHFGRGGKVHRFSVNEHGIVSEHGILPTVDSVHAYAVGDEYVYVAEFRGGDNPRVYSAIVRYMDNGAGTMEVGGALELPGVITDISVSENAIVVGRVWFDGSMPISGYSVLGTASDQLVQIAEVVASKWQSSRVLVSLTVNGLFVATHTAAESNGALGMVLRYDVTNLMQPELVGEAFVWGEVTDIEPADDRLYIGMAGDTRLGFNRGLRGVSVFDIEEEDSLKYLHHVRIPVPVEDLALSQGQLFAATGAGGVYQLALDGEAIVYSAYIPHVAR